MVKLVQAELRKSWKMHRFLMAVLCFLCFMGCAYAFDIHKGLAYHYQETPNIRLNYDVARNRFVELNTIVKFSPADQITPEIREKRDLWEDTYNKIYRYLLLRQEYEGYTDRITQVAYDSAASIYDMRTHAYYEGEFEETGITLKQVKLEKEYYQYMLEHDIVMYENGNEPTVCNFLIYMFQNETMILFVIIAAFFLVDAICSDFDGNCYTLVYTQPHSRIRMMCAKVISVLIMLTLSFVAAFVLFSPWLLFQHGFGYLDYPYIVGNEILSYGQFLGRIALLVIMTLLFFAAVCVIAANVFKNTTNTLLLIAALLIVQYLVNMFFKVHLWYGWLPIFYLEPFEIVMGNYPLSSFACMGICLAFIIVLWLLFVKVIKWLDLKGSEAL